MTGFAIAAICRTSSTLGTGVDRFASGPTALSVSRSPDPVVFGVGRKRSAAAASAQRRYDRVGVQASPAEGGGGLVKGLWIRPVFALIAALMVLAAPVAATAGSVEPAKEPT